MLAYYESTFLDDAMVIGTSAMVETELDFHALQVKADIIKA